MPKNSQGRDIAEIIPDKCIGCQLCVGECPVSAIEMKDGVAHVNPDLCIGCGRCSKVCPVNAVIFEKPVKKKVTGPGQEPRPLDDYRGVAVFIEVANGIGANVAWELVGQARKIAEKLGSSVFGFLLGDKVGSVADEAITYGCDAVHTVDDPALKTYISRLYGRALEQVCREVKPEVLLLGATPLGRDLAPVVAARLNTGLTADCTGLDIDAETRLLVMTRPTFGGNIMASILCRSHRPQMSTVRPGVMKQPLKETGRKGEVRRLTLEKVDEALPRVVDFIAAVAGGADITQASALVVVGKGACNSRYVPMLEELAELLGGTIACSRPVVEAGLLPYERQVGQTGRTVSPRLYIGVGVSGSVQHQAGMQGSEKIIAINTDREAPLVGIADYAIIGDYTVIVPELIKGIKERTGKVGKT
ncbi:MAG TPA: FAD-binding protein [Dehalococcoidales bacterium]|nr:FAD-binding protein [Dehalococcoidales bacterium]